MRRRSNKWPVFLLTTGCWGTSPEMAQYILALVNFGKARRSLALWLEAARPCWQALAVPGAAEAFGGVM